MLGIKGRYVATAKKLSAMGLGGDAPPRPEVADAAVRSLDEMAGMLDDVRKLIPEVVVKQVREREAKLRALTAAAAN